MIIFSWFSLLLATHELSFKPIEAVV